MGVRAAGTNIALLGGLIATIALILSGIVGWILSAPEVVASTPSEGTQFPQLPARRNRLRGWIRLAGRRSVGHLLLHAASAAMAGRLRNALGTHGRTLLPQPRFISGKILYPCHQVSGLHLDVFSRSGTDQRSQRSAARLGQRHRIDHVSGTLVLADHPASLASFSCGFRRLLGVRPSQTLLHTSLPRCHRRTQAPCTRPSGTTLNASVS